MTIYSTREQVLLCYNKGMSIYPVQTPETTAGSRPVSLTFESGDRLSRAEFERRYETHPEIKKAELVEGIVYVTHRVRLDHGRLHALLVGWLGWYSVDKPGTDVADSASVRLDHKNEVQPDGLLRIKTEYGGRSRITTDDFLEGAPELIVEVATSSAAYDLHDKKQAYARNDVLEYVVVQIYEQRVDWFSWNSATKQYDSLAADDQGIFRSQVFPGLWLDNNAFWEEERTQMMTTLQQSA